MITPWTIYWVTRADSLHGLTVTLSFASTCLLIFSPLIPLAMDDFGFDNKTGRRAMASVIKSAIGVLLVSLALLTFLPTTKEVAAMIVLPKIVNNEDLQALGSDIPKLAREWLESLKPEKSKETK